MRISKHRPDYFVVDFDRPQITLCQVADQHYLKDAVLDNGRNRETLERLILIVRPDFIVHSGDLQDDSNADIDEKTGGFASFVVNDLPWTLALGNHDPDLDKVVNGFRKTVALLPLGRQDRARELFLFPPLDANNVSRVCRIDFRVDGDPRPSFGLVVFDSGGGDRLPISINANRSQLDFFVAEIARDATKDNPYGEPVDHPLLAVIHVPLPEFANVAVDAPRKGLRFEKINDEDDSHDPLPFDVLRSSGRIRGILSGHDHMNSYFGTAGPDTTMELIYGRKSGFGAYDPTDNAYGGRIIQIDLAARTYAHREIIVKANDVLAGEPLRKDR